MDWKLRKISLLVKYVLCALLLYPSHGFPFATDSHRIINEQAARGSQAFDPYLNDVLGFSSGLNTNIKSNRGVEKSILNWIGDGGVAEDDLVRFLAHFHHPLRSWGQAGLGRIALSSVRWAQSSQSPNRPSSWRDGRNSFFAALTASAEEAREAKFAETFQTVGQLMHLVADLASVPHTRDDAHPFAYSLESFVKKRPELIGGFFDFDKSILSQGTGDPVAIVPIARLWDTDTYDGSNPPGDANQQIGLAEFSHANFFSRDTIKNFSGADPDFPLPVIGRLDPGPTTIDPRTGNPGLYLSKNGDGASVTHMVRVGLFSDFATSVPFLLDDLVYRDYAQYLLPRAIGYSAGIIDYFFRGRMEVVLSEDQPSETEVRAKVSNTTPGEDTMNETAQVVGVLEYQLSGESEKFYSVSLSQQVTLTSTPQELVFPLTPPPGAENAFLYVVYKGQLGLEEEAVMVGRAPLMDLRPEEPTLVCPDGSIQFTVVGGKPPYTWSTTKGEITPDADTKGAALKPSENNPDVVGIAYVRIAGGVTNDKPVCIAGDATVLRYNCADELRGCAPPNNNIVEACGGTFVDCAPGSEEVCIDKIVLACQQLEVGIDCGVPECGETQPENLDICDFALANPLVAPVCDQRTQAMIDAGCRPCSIEMEGGAIVTVTDADGQSASTTVMAQ